MANIDERQNCSSYSWRPCGVGFSGYRDHPQCIYIGPPNWSTVRSESRGPPSGPVPVDSQIWDAMVSSRAPEMMSRELENWWYRKSTIDGHSSSKTLNPEKAFNSLCQNRCETMMKYFLMKMNWTTELCQKNTRLGVNSFWWTGMVRLNSTTSETWRWKHSVWWTRKGRPDVVKTISGQCWDLVW